MDDLNLYLPFVLLFAFILGTGIVVHYLTRNETLFVIVVSVTTLVYLIVAPSFLISALFIWGGAAMILWRGSGRQIPIMRILNRNSIIPSLSAFGIGIDIALILTFTVVGFVLCGYDKDKELNTTCGLYGIMVVILLLTYCVIIPVWGIYLAILVIAVIAFMEKR